MLPVYGKKRLSALRVGGYEVASSYSAYGNPIYLQSQTGDGNSGVGSGKSSKSPWCLAKRAAALRRKSEGAGCRGFEEGKVRCSFSSVLAIAEYVLRSWNRRVP